MSMNVVNAFSGASALPDKAASSAETPSSGADFGKVLNELAKQGSAALPKSDESKPSVDTGAKQIKNPNSETAQKEACTKGNVRIIDSGGADGVDAELAGLLAKLQKLRGQPGDNETAQAALMELIMQMQQRLRELTPEDGQQVAAQQMVAALVQDLPGVDVLSGAGYAASSEGLVAAFLAAAPEELLAVTQMPQNRADANALPLSGYAEQMQKAQGGELEASVSYTKVPMTPEKPEASFEELVRAAKDLMAKSDTEKPQNSQKPQTDIDALQSRVDAGTYLQGTPLAAPIAGEINAPHLVEVPLSSQVEQGVISAMKAGQEQFSIKLAPEGLGELTISMVKTAEGTRLSIIAKNPETQKLLAAEMNQLRESLRSLKVDVDSILTERQYEMLSNQQSFDQQQRQNWRGYHAPEWYGDEPLSAGWELEAAQALAAASSGIYTGNVSLDTYI